MGFNTKVFFINTHYLLLNFITIKQQYERND